MLTPDFNRYDLPMENVESSTTLRLPRYGGVALLTLMASGCLPLSYVNEAWFVRILRITAGLGLAWIVARLLPNGLFRRSYWLCLPLFCGFSGQMRRLLN